MGLRSAGAAALSFGARSTVRSGLPGSRFRDDGRFRQPFGPRFFRGIPYGVWGGWDDSSYDSGYAGGDAGYASSDAGPGDGYGPDAYGPPPPAYMGVARVPETLPSEDAVTVMFKDGRPAEQIHNYALSRTILYVMDGRNREIAVAAIDVAATEKVNRENGVSFQLPQVAQ
jgi:hypothetical protein